MAEKRKGRKSQADYREMIGKALLSDRFTLEEFPVLSQLPGIEKWAAAHPYELLPRGKALESLLGKAVADAIVFLGDAKDTTTRRVAEYLRLRYQEQKKVKDIAQEWQLSVDQVSRTAGRRALDIATERFLMLAHSLDKHSKPDKNDGN